MDPGIEGLLVLYASGSKLARFASDGNASYLQAPKLVALIDCLTIEVQQQKPMRSSIRL